jgi:dnd system-associated protein 4
MSDMDSSRSDRINIDESVIEIYDSLRTETIKNAVDIEEAPFVTNKDIFMYAVCLGYQNGVRKKLPSGKKSTIRREVFTENDLAILEAIAIADIGDVKVLANWGEILTISEEYAHTGILRLKELLLDQGGRPLWNLRDMITSHQTV